MLTTAFRGGTAAVRRAGWRAALLALVVSALTVLPELFALAALPVVLLLNLALIRVLAAHRDTPVPEHVTVDDADRSPRTAVTRVGRMAFPAIRLALVNALLAISIGLLTLLLSGHAGDDLADLTTAEERQFAVGGGLLFALFSTFIAVAPQRIALEGDSRVLIALAHSVRIARAYFGSLLTLGLAEFAIVGLPFALLDVGWPGAVAQAIVGTAVSLLLVATATEIYLAGPRLDVPAEFGRRPRKDPPDPPPYESPR